jgi:hypothetical protein
MMEVKQDITEQTPAVQTPWEAPELVMADVAAMTLAAASGAADGSTLS